MVKLAMSVHWATTAQKDRPKAPVARRVSNAFDILQSYRAIFSLTCEEFAIAYSEYRKICRHVRNKVLISLKVLNRNACTVFGCSTQLRGRKSSLGSRRSLECDFCAVLFPGVAIMDGRSLLTTWIPGTSEQGHVDICRPSWVYVHRDSQMKEVFSSGRLQTKFFILYRNVWQPHEANQRNGMPALFGGILLLWNSERGPEAEVYQGLLVHWWLPRPHPCGPAVRNRLPQRKLLPRGDSCSGAVSERDLPADQENGEGVRLFAV